MNLFPTQYSTLSAIALKDHIGERYGLDIVACRLLIRNVSDVYLLESEIDKYIFKIYRNSYRSIGEIKGEVQLLNILRERGAPVSFAIRDLSGSQIQQFQAAEGIRNGVLFSFAKGNVVANPDAEQLRIIGRSVAGIHEITAECELDYDRIVYDVESTLRKPLEIIAPRFTALPGEYEYLREIADRTIEKLGRFDLASFNYGYCHYDLIPKNFHFDERNRITFFDFDWVGKGWLVNDHMTLFFQYFFLVQRKIITREDAERNFMIFVGAYREQRNLSEEELEAIPYLGIMFWIFGFGFYEDNFDDFSNTFLTPRFIRDRVETIRKWVEMYCGF